MNTRLIRRMPLLVMIAVYVAALVVVSRVVPEPSTTGAGRVSYTFSPGRPLRVVMKRNPVEESQEQDRNLVLGIAVFTSFMLSFTLLDFPGKGVAGEAIRFVLSALFTAAVFVFLGGMEAPLRSFDGWELATIVLRIPCLLWVVALQFLFVIDRGTQVPLDAAMRPSSGFLVGAGYCFLAVGLVILDYLV